MTVASATTIHEARFRDLSPDVLYEILRLRIDAFVVEQGCVFPDLDGRDREDATWHLWAQTGNDVVACLRIVAEADGSDTIGRVVTAPAYRRQGVSTRLMRQALDRAARPARVKAQSRLAGWYASFGFVPVGAEFVEDGIAHTHMSLT